MPIQKKNTILAIATGAVFLLAFLVNDPFLIFEKSYEKSKPVISGRAERVKKVTVSDGAQKRIFTRSTEGWSAELAGSPLGVQRADSQKIDAGLNNLFEARRYQEVSSNKEKQADYEVRDTDFQLLLEGENGDKIAQVVLGKFSGAGNASFMRLADDTSVYAVKGFLKGDWNQEFDLYRDRTVLRVARENVREIRASGKTSVTLKADDKGSFTLEPARATDKSRINTFLADLTELTGVKFHKDALPAPYGKISVLLSSNVTKEVEFFGPTKDQEFVARSSDMPSPVTIARSKVEALFPKLDDLLEKAPLPNLSSPK